MQAYLVPIISPKRPKNASPARSIGRLSVDRTASESTAKWSSRLEVGTAEEIHFRFRAIQREITGASLTLRILAKPDGESRSKEILRRRINVENGKIHGYDPKLLAYHAVETGVPVTYTHELTLHEWKKDGRKDPNYGPRVDVQYQWCRLDDERMRSALFCYDMVNSDDADRGEAQITLTSIQHPGDHLLLPRQPLPFEKTLNQRKKPPLSISIFRDGFEPMPKFRRMAYCVLKPEWTTGRCPNTGSRW